MFDTLFEFKSRLLLYRKGKYSINSDNALYRLNGEVFVVVIDFIPLRQLFSLRLVCRNFALKVNQYLPILIERRHQSLLAIEPRIVAAQQAFDACEDAPNRDKLVDLVKSNATLIDEMRHIAPKKVEILHPTVIITANKLRILLKKPYTLQPKPSEIKQYNIDSHLLLQEWSNFTKIQYPPTFPTDEFK
jgi:hypothetical protein